MSNSLYLLVTYPHTKHYLHIRGIRLSNYAYVGDKYQTVNDGVAHSKNPRKCAYHVTFDLGLGLDLEHTLDAC